uniref:Uncharacterized protein n=1 Tax=Iridovirus LCIVAC01 TaxID=2506607 RepID=A0A481YPM6_9VIRU|nr:MAG: hypothetical protein LCIVAC01_00620 [Iridovirus LCIVAC01]
MANFKRVYSFCETPPGVIKAVDCGIGTPANNEYSFFNSQLFTEECFTMNFASTVLFRVLTPEVGAFQVNNLASSSPGSTITSSGINSQFIDTVEAGSYRFHVNFTISNVIAGLSSRPRFTFTLGTPAATPYTNPDTGFLQVSTEFEVFTVTTNFFGVFECVIHGVVDLPANSSTTILLKPDVLTPDKEYDFGTFNVEVTRIA